MANGNGMRARAACAWLACAVACLLAAACAHGTQTASRREAALRRAVAAYERRADSANVGYGVQTRRSVLGPVGSLRLDRDDAWARGSRLEELLEGRVTGVEVQRLADGDFSVRVRGTASVGGGGEPLWVIDGIPMAFDGSVGHFLRDINPGDVARIDVLKGSAAAIYGSRGSNGVILVTLRRASR